MATTNVVPIRTGKRAKDSPERVKTYVVLERDTLEKLEQIAVQIGTESAGGLVPQPTVAALMRKAIGKYIAQWST